MSRNGNVSPQLSRSSSSSSSYWSDSSSPGTPPTPPTRQAPAPRSPNSRRRAAAIARSNRNAFLREQDIRASLRAANVASQEASRDANASTRAAARAIRLLASISGDESLLNMPPPPRPVLRRASVSRTRSEFSTTSNMAGRI